MELPPPSTPAVDIPPPSGPPLVAPGDPVDGPRAWAWWAGPAAIVGALLAASIAGAMIIGIAALAGADVSSDGGLKAPGGVTMLSLVAQDVCFVAAPIMLAGIFSKPVRPWMFGLRRPSWLKAFGWILVTYGVFLGLSALWQQFVDFNNESQVTDSLGVTANDGAAIAGAFLVCVLAPIAEEILFRGFLFTTLRNKIGVWGGAVISGALFGAIHIGSAPAGALPILALLGMLFCGLYVVTGSLLPCIAAHCLNNAVAYGGLVDWDWQIPVTFVLALTVILALHRGVEQRFGIAPPAAAST